MGKPVSSAIVILAALNTTFLLLANRFLTCGSMY